MKVLTVVALAAACFIALAPTADADEFVKGYTRKDGTFVQPHVRSSPDNSYNNNWSVQPNVNPYTGQSGTRQPTYNDRAPVTNPYGSPRRY
jgi:hypothetical protein